MSAEQATEILYKIPLLGIEWSLKTFNFYANTGVNLKNSYFNLFLLQILLFGFFSILYLLKKSNKNLKDEDNYDWTKYNISSDKRTTL